MVGVGGVGSLAHWCLGREGRRGGGQREEGKGGDRGRGGRGGTERERIGRGEGGGGGFVGRSFREEGLAG